MRKLSSLRNECFNRQAGRCYYCCQPMWRDDLCEFASSYRIPEKSAGRLKATAEHLTARCDGGADEEPNIVAACVYCNGRRHRRKVALPPADYGRKVRHQLARGKWHGLRLV
jgi:hypothetical protein